jgi:uncharacterized protein (DUF1778 family)
MRAFQDATRDVDQPASERMNFRTKPHIKEAIHQAAALSGVDDSVFTMSAAYSSALATIAAHERTLLEPVDHAAFFAALDKPTKPTKKLRDALARHQARIVSK